MGPWCSHPLGHVAEVTLGRCYQTVTERPQPRATQFTSQPQTPERTHHRGDSRAALANSDDVISWKMPGALSMSHSMWLLAVCSLVGGWCTLRHPDRSRRGRRGRQSAGKSHGESWLVVCGIVLSSLQLCVMTSFIPFLRSGNRLWKRTLVAHL